MAKTKKKKEKHLPMNKPINITVVEDCLVNAINDDGDDWSDPLHKGDDLHVIVTERIEDGDEGDILDMEIVGDNTTLVGVNERWFRED